MKSLFTAVAILLTATAFGQTTVKAKDTIGQHISNKWESIHRTNLTYAGGWNFSYYGEIDITGTNQIAIGSKKSPVSIPTTTYTFSLNGDKQTQRRNDTLTIIDKTIRFIIVDGVTYEVVRSTEVKKVDMQPLRFYSNGITITPNYLSPNKN